LSNAYIDTPKEKKISPKVTIDTPKEKKSTSMLEKSKIYLDFYSLNRTFAG